LAKIHTILENFEIAVSPQPGKILFSKSNIRNGTFNFENKISPHGGFTAISKGSRTPAN